MELITALTIGGLFGVGLYQMLRRNVIRSAIGLVIIANAINLLLLTIGVADGTVPAYVGETAGIRSDALPQALILTAIVISMGGTAFVLAMLSIISARFKTADMDKLNGLKQ